jgi:hypothetical protein
MMTTNHRAGSFWAILLAAGGLVACESTAARPDGGGASGGHSGDGGHSGNGGAATGGSGGNYTVVCGSGPYAPTLGIKCHPVESSGVISNFTYDPDGGATDQVRFGMFGTTLSGGESVFANSPGMLMSNVTGSDWHISGNIANYAGIGLYFENCNVLDASAFGGISFTIWGTAANNMMTMDVGILDDTPSPAWEGSVGADSNAPKAGACIPSSGSEYYHPGCADPTSSFNVTGTQASPQTITLRWTDFTGGMCRPNVDPSQILGISWQFLWSATATPYAVDIHIDNLMFIP